MNSTHPRLSSYNLHKLNITEESTPQHAKKFVSLILNAISLHSGKKLLGAKRNTSLI